MSNQRPPIQVLSAASNDQSRLALQAMLTKIPGLALTEVADASEALQKLRDKNIDVALVDLSLNDTSGIELTKQIRQSHPNVRVLICTASDRPDDIFAAMDAGADGYMLKENLSKVLEIAIRSVRLGAVWLDPGIARQVLQVMETTATASPARILPTGLMRLPLMPEEKSLLTEVAKSNCIDGVCMVDPSFITKLRRYSPSSA